jgi:hypothetical protein
MSKKSTSDYMYVSDELLPIGLKITKIINSVPCVDGHFWIERDGKIIDPHFPEQDDIMRVHRGVKFVYKPADEMTCTMITVMHYRIIEEGGYENLGDFLIDYQMITGEEPRQGYCFFNAMMVQEEGDNLIFGSWGVERADGTKFWEYGGEDWTGVKAFIKRRYIKRR